MSGLQMRSTLPSDGECRLAGESFPLLSLLAEHTDDVEH
jgi:hypothetical protein